MKKNFYPFMLEREMGTWEHQVQYNLSESGVHPMSTAELLGNDTDLIKEFLAVELNYIQTNGTVELRERIAGIYPGATPDDITVTKAIVKAGKLLDIEVLDHVVIGQGKFVSLKERSLGF